MTDFWQEHSQDGSLEEMMLDTNAAELTKHELPEILSYLPSWEGKDVLELGAGIGYVGFLLVLNPGHLPLKYLILIEMSWMEKRVLFFVHIHHSSITTLDIRVRCRKTFT